MKSLILLLPNLIIITLTQRTYPPFREYINIFSKNYNQAKQYSFRQNIYNERVAHFASITLYEPGINNMSDWTNEEINQYKNLMNVDPNERVARPPPGLTRLASPQSIDWRQLGAVTSVKSQGRCGSCWAFAAAGYAESKLIVDKRFTNITINLSEQYLVSCTKFSNCSGGYLQYAMKAAIKLPTQSSYPYRPYSNQQPSICSADGIVIGQRSVNYYNLKDSQLIALLLNSPIPVAISSIGWENYGSGIFQCSDSSLIGVDHAVLLVGYTADYWIVKNQWGVLWGQEGYIRITRKGTNNCRIGTSAHIIQGTYNPTNDSSYSSNEQPTNPIKNNTVTLNQQQLYPYLALLLAFIILVY